MANSSEESDEDEYRWALFRERILVNSFICLFMLIVELADHVSKWTLKILSSY